MNAFRSFNWHNLYTEATISLTLFLIPDIFITFAIMLLAFLKIITGENALKYIRLTTSLSIALWLTVVLAISLNENQFATISSILSIVALLSFLYKEK